MTFTVDIESEKDQHDPAVCSNFIARIEVREGYDPHFLTYLHGRLYLIGVNKRSIKQTTGIQNLDVLWDALMAAGEPAGLSPMGMLALDRARIEAGLLAGGREFDDFTSPYQAGIGWAVALKKLDFIGKTALEQIKPHPPKVAVGLVLESNEVAAYGQCVHPLGERWRVGVVTSATFSPILNRSIALAQVAPESAVPGTELEVGFMDGMKRRVKATVGPLSAYDPTKSRVKS